MTIRQSSAQEAKPVLHRTLGADPTFVQTSALFGYTMAMGKLRGPSDTRDDVVACAIDEDTGALLDTGAAYVFEEQLLLPPSDKPLRLQPSVPADALQMGRLDIEIDNVRGLTGTGDPYSNLIIVGCVGRTARYPNCGRAIALAGSVELYDFNHADFTGQAYSLIAPLNPGSCPAAAPEEVSFFGNAIAVGDVTRDGIRDLIVGAPVTDVTPDDQLGRLYSFAGRSDFVPTTGQPGPYPPNAWQAWIGINAPLDDVGSTFGHSIVADTIADTGVADVVVGRPDRINRAPTASPQGGAAYVLRGQWLHDLFGGSTLNTVVQPPLVGGVGWDSCSPQYQVLPNPFGTQSQSMGDQFGWQVFAVGDVGSPPSVGTPNTSGPPDGIADIAIHAEDTNYIVNGTSTAPNGAGGLFVYFGRRDMQPPCPGQVLVDPGYFLIQRPSAFGPPLQGDRFGRACVGIDLYNPLTQLVERGLLAGEPGSPPTFPGHGGAAFLIRLPFTRTASGTPSTPSAWASPLLEPANPALDHLFGGWIVAGDYLGSSKSIPGQQFVVSAREAVAQDQFLVSHAGAGRAYSFVPAGGP